ncbi:MAG TPA: cell wall-binding repeat-containing protein [Nitriliruptorales bacterium]|nr:cell wall-binding repeat-containing protein [Nitriliruptorales bacterium]
MRTQWRAGSGLLAGLVTAGALVAAPSEERAAAQATGLELAPNYEVRRVESPEPSTGGQFGGNIQNAGDLNGDGVDDLLAPEGVGNGLVRVIIGADGSHVYTVRPPDPRAEGRRSAEYGGMVGRVADLGSCPGGTPGEECPDSAVGPQDQVPEFAVGAYRVDIGDALEVGRVYVYDGATGALVKRLQMPPDDLASEAAIPVSQRSFPFGRSVLSPSSEFPLDAPEAVKIGDMNGGGMADIVVGNSSFYEAGPATNPNCDPGPCNGAGRVYFFAGEDIAGSSPSVPLDTPFKVIRNPEPRTNDPFYQGLGHTLAHIGDVGGCDTDPGAGVACPSANSKSDPDGLPDVVVSHIRADQGEFEDAGRGWLLDGETGAVLRRLDHPQPQTGSLFSYTQAYGGAVGDVAGSPHPDVILTSPFQDVTFADQGRAWVFNGNHRTSATGVVLSQLDDPEPKHAGFFGLPTAPIGDVQGDPYNEVLVGNAAFFGGDASAGIIGAAYIFSPATADLVRVFDDPDQRPGSAFGGGVASLGDVNGDGWLDFAVGAPRFAGGAGLNQGRLYLFHSAPAPVPTPTPTPTPSPTPTPTPTPQGTDGPTTEEGTVRLAGPDRIGTAVAVSRDDFADGTVRAALLARADDFADALTGTPLAVAVDGPVLLTPTDQLHPTTTAELQRILRPDAVVYLLGGGAALSDTVEQAVRELGYTTRRVFGPTRIETAIAVARALGNPEVLLITTGDNFPDALAAGAAAGHVKGSVLLTPADRPHPSLDAYLSERPDAQRYAVGGPAARAYPATTTVFGATRDETAVEVAKRFFANPTQVGIARRDDFPDALTGGAHISRLGGPMLLTPVAALHEVTADYLCANAASIRRAFLYGGKAAVSDHALQQADERIRGRGC